MGHYYEILLLKLLFKLKLKGNKTATQDIYWCFSLFLCYYFQWSSFIVLCEADEIWMRHKTCNAELCGWKMEWLKSAESFLYFCHICDGVPLRLHCYDIAFRHIWSNILCAWYGVNMLQLYNHKTKYVIFFSFVAIPLLLLLLISIFIRFVSIEFIFRVKYHAWQYYKSWCRHNNRPLSVMVALETVSCFLRYCKRPDSGRKLTLCYTYHAKVQILNTLYSNSMLCSNVSLIFAILLDQNFL